MKYSVEDSLGTLSSKFCGALKSPDDPSDYIFEHLSFGRDTITANGFNNLTEINMSKYANPARDQKKRGTCSAFAGVTIKEIKNRILHPDQIDALSPEFIYYHRDNKPTEGMFGRNVFQILRDIGTVPENLYPYQENSQLAVQPSEHLYSIASQYKIKSFAKILTCDGLKRALSEIGPCYLVLPLFKNRPHFWRGESRGSTSSANKSSPSGGHAVTVIGYNTEGFILRNSWGRTWNGDGNVIFPYHEWDLFWECWIPLDMPIVNTEEKSLNMSTVMLDDEITLKDSPGRVKNTRKRMCNII
jgi:hypothetical protein